MSSAQKLKLDALSKEMVPGSRVSQDGRGSGEGRNDWCEVQGEAESKTMVILAVQLANKGENDLPPNAEENFVNLAKLHPNSTIGVKNLFFTLLFTLSRVFQVVQW